MKNNHYFELIKEMTFTDFRIRYGNSIIGFSWSFLKPVFMFTILYIVFTYLVKITVKDYAFFLFFGIILWNSFAESTSIAMGNMLSKRKIIRNIYFRREILVISACLNAMITTVITSAILIIALYIYGFNIYLSSILLFIVFLFMLLVFSLSISFILVSFYTKFRDLVHIWNIFLQMGFFLTPITYSSSIIPAKYLELYLMNPLSRIMTYSRDALLYNQVPDIRGFVICIFTIIILIIIGIKIFSIRNIYFSEEV